MPPPGDLPDPGIEPRSPMSPHWQGGSLPPVPLGKPLYAHIAHLFYSIYQNL